MEPQHPDHPDGRASEPEHPGRPDSSERALWAACAASAEPAAPCPGPLVLAEYLDRRGDEQEAITIEHHLAACDDCLAAVRDATAVHQEALPLIAADRLAAARALRPAPVVARPPAVMTIRRAWRCGLAAAASIAVCAAGWSIGTGSATPSAGAPAVADLTFGLLETDDELEFAMLVMSSGEDLR